jgi:hypothetical protein
MKYKISAKLDDR